MNRNQEMLAYVNENINRFQSELMELVKIPSISTAPAHTDDMQATAQWIQKYLTKLGYKSEIFPTAKHPIVFAESPDPETQGNRLCPTVLIYGHYDVQPSDPDDAWDSAPFTPTIVNRKMFGRGTSDMKGQFIATAAAAEAFRKFYPDRIKLKFLIEGEEEIGSPNFETFLKEHKEMLKADVALNPDAGMISKDIPMITLGLRGIAFFELTVFGPNRDLHSGSYGGVIENPIHILGKIIGNLHNEKGKINIPGMYDDVIDLPDSERESINLISTNEASIRTQTGVPEVWGEEHYTIPERIGVRPSLSVNGIFGGYSGNGSKTIIPSSATAKISIRLVKNQDPKIIEKQIREYFKQVMPKTVTWEMTNYSGSKAAKTNPNHPSNQAMIKALEEIWSKKTVYKMEGGSISVVNTMETVLGLESILTGFGLAGDKIHSPNESLDLDCWEMGIKALSLFFSHYCEQQ